MSKRVTEHHDQPKVLTEASCVTKEGTKMNPGTSGVKEISHPNVTFNNTS